MERRLAIGLGTAVAVLAAGGGVAALTWPSAAPAVVGEAATTVAPPASAEPSSGPPALRTTIDSVDLAAAVTAGGGVDLRQRATKPFSMLSVSWTDPAAVPRGGVEVRTRAARTGKWTGWQRLDVAEGSADLPAEASRVRGVTDPLWAGRSSGVAVRIAGGGELPRGLALNLIDPDVPAGGTGGRGGGEPDPSAGPSGPATGEPTEPPTTAPATETPPPATTPPATTAPATTPPTPTLVPPGKPPVTTAPVKAQLPPYVSRAGWKADEKLVVDPVSLAPQVKMVWVHHTATSNTYACTESASIVRAIQANDVRVKDLADIGYNFLVDKCGTLFEGRKGGVTNAVIGAHSVGFNTGSLGIALIGNQVATAPSAAALTTIAQVAAARLGAYGFSPTSSAQMTEGSDGRIWPKDSLVTFPRIAGHKDGQLTAAGYLTECPGTLLNTQLDTIRSRSLQMVTGLTAKAGGGIVSGISYVRTSVPLTWSLDTPSAQIARFEIVRDGAVAATLPGTARTGSVALKAGSHTVAVRAVHVSGGTALTPGLRVIADVTAPVVTTPAPTLRTGTYSATAAPVSVSFRATDNVRLYGVTATAPARVPLATTATAWSATMRPGANTRFMVTARDVPGNVRTVSVTRKATILTETSAKRGGTWTTRAGTAYLSGRTLASAKKGAKLTYTFTGRSAALLFARTPATGQAVVYLDGKKVATIDTRASKPAYRQAVWVRSLSAGKHTVALVVAGTTGRPTVVSDGLAYIG